MWLRELTKPWFIVTCAGALVCLVSVAAALLTPPKYEQALRAQGYPTNLDELNAWYPPVPAAENAAPRYHAAGVHMWHSTRELREHLPICGRAKLPEDGTVPPEMDAAIREYLQNNEKALSMAYAAMDYPRCRYPIDLSKGYDADFRYTAGTWALGKLMRIDGLRSTLDGDAEGVMRAIAGQRALADSRRGMPLLGRYPSYMSGVEDTLILALGRIPFSAGQLERLQAMVAPPENATLSLERALVSEMLAAFAIGPTGGRRDLPTLGVAVNALGWSTSNVLHWTGWGDFYRVACVRAVRSILADAQEAPERLADSRVRDMADHLPFLRCLYVQYLVGSLNNSGLYHLSCVQRRGLTAAVLAIERFHLDTERLPKDLEELVPRYLDEVPRDYFALPESGAGQGLPPIQYRPQEKGYLLYSLGENRRDDGGTRDRDRHRGDLVFEVDHRKRT